MAQASYAPVEPREQSQAFLTEGDIEYERGAFEPAILKYEAAYYNLSPADRASYLGSIPIRKAMRAYEQRLAAEDDPDERRRIRERQRVVIDEFLYAVAQKDGAAEEVGAALLTRLEETRTLIGAALQEEEVAEPVEPAPEPEPEPEPETEPQPEPDVREEPIVDSGPTTEVDSPKPRRDWVGLGLIIGGSALLGTGLGLTAGWWTVPKDSQRVIDENPDRFPTPEDETAWLEGDVQDHARKFLIAGTVIAGVGLAVTIGGTVRLVLHRRKSTLTARTRVAPILGPQTMGLTLRHRF